MTGGLPLHATELHGLRAMHAAWTMRLQGTPAMLDRTRAMAAMVRFT